MSLKIKVPEVGESITEVTIATWLKQDGDQVAMDEVLCELESEKATFELPAEADGILKIVAQEGETLEVGAVICEIEEKKGEGSPQTEKKKDEKAGDSTPKSEQKSSAPKSTGEFVEMRVPEVGESITEVTLSSWSKEDGSRGRAW